jgi:hypothetical protein
VGLEDDMTKYDEGGARVERRVRRNKVKEERDRYKAYLETLEKKLAATTLSHSWIAGLIHEALHGPVEIPFG